MKLQLLEACVQASIKILIAASVNKGFHNLTGNTLTSYMIGIYEDNKLLRCVSISEAADIKSPTHTKLTNSSGYAVFDDYDSGRTFKVYLQNMTRTDEDYGENTSRHFLMSFRPNVPKGFSLVFTTGTEYSVIKEEIVRTITTVFDVSPSILFDTLVSTPLPQQ